jgi:UDP-glucose 4-epimerase
MMRWFDQVHGIRYVALRYFNAAGAHASGRIGEDHQPETHLVPIVLGTALGKHDEITVYGSDYPTHDGTCIRDFVHVSDLADAHLLAVDYLGKDGTSEICNLGNGNGFSVLEVIRTAERVTGLTIPMTLRDRRAGDPAVLVACANKAKALLGWQPSRARVEDIIESAWCWHQAHPDGYAK